MNVKQPVNVKMVEHVQTVLAALRVIAKMDGKENSVTQVSGLTYLTYLTNPLVIFCSNLDLYYYT